MEKVRLDEGFDRGTVNTGGVCESVLQQLVMNTSYRLP